ncbi:ATP-grasp domain-containing protein [Yinghuangia seranimata]|uniref:ATP-grasp domain-containing protein n=1 Tax=Yinghuangia seranimata TaxID=408067 RepID=UPI00248A96DA|nr:ATP-grasp domain-containing protein [Yinghuangia seranimata]MDI2126362.1 ATP-grasp domain-containing protein [Yinghuangia seranimata]
MTSRQVALLLARAGHEVDLLAPEGRPPLRLPPEVGRVHPVPAFGSAPWQWLEAAEKIARVDGHDVLIPAGDQVAVLSRADAGSGALAGRVAVPRFAALERVQDKVSAAVTLTEIGLPQPEGTVVKSAEALRQVADPPLYVKLAVGSRGDGVFRIARREELLALADRLEADGVFAGGGRVLVQHPAQGQMISAQAVFDNGRLVAAHVFRHVRSDGRSGAVAKQSVDMPSVREHITLLGAHVGWHGALSMDGVLTADGPMWIDVNPRLVEPANAVLSGTDLVAALIGVSVGQAPPAALRGRPAVMTHQFVPALLAAAGEGRLAVLRELWQATVRGGVYRDSAEELLSPRTERRAIPSLLGLAAGLLTAPDWAVRRARRGEDVEALTASAWGQIRAGAPPGDLAPTDSLFRE